MQVALMLTIRILTNIRGGRQRMSERCNIRRLPPPLLALHVEGKGPWAKECKWPPETWEEHLLCTKCCSRHSGYNDGSWWTLEARKWTAHQRPPRRNTVLADTLISAQSTHCWTPSLHNSRIREFALFKLLDLWQAVASTMDNKYTSSSGLRRQRALRTFLPLKVFEKRAPLSHGAGTWSSPSPTMQAHGLC